MARLQGPAPQAPIQVIEIPLTEGITTYGNGYEIGPRPRALSNIVRAPSTSRPGRLGTRPPTPNSTATATMAAADASHTNQYLVGLGSDQQKAYAFGVFTVGGVPKLGLWVVATGAAQHTASSGTYTAITSTTDTQRFPAASAWWESQGKLYYSHPQCTASEIMESSGTPAAYTTPAGRASALAVHLDRLFIAQPSGSGFTGSSTLVKMTDPLDPSTIRSSRSFTVDDYVRAMLRLGAGDLDVAGQAHLLIGGLTSVAVFDGDPDVGNASYRVLNDTVGVQSPTLWVNTPYGVFALGTDGQLYRIPTGAGSMEPVGSRVRDQFTGYADIPRVTSPATLLWSPPYLLLFPPSLPTSVTGFQYGTLIMDLSDPGVPEWTGPHTVGTARLMMGAMRIPDTPTSATVSYIAERTTSALKVYPIDAAPAVATTQLVRTGYLSWPGHDVILQRVIAVMPTDATDYTATCTMYADVSGQERTVTRTVAGAVGAGWDARRKIVFVTVPPLRGDAVWFELSGGVPQRLLAEVRVVPRQD